VTRRKEPELARQAARDPDRPGERCLAEPGSWRPVVDVKRCEGRASCEAVCPYDVFEVGRIAGDVYQALPFFTRLEIRVHGMQTAYTPNVDACRGCGLCVVACPEQAIRIERP